MPKQDLMRQVKNWLEFVVLVVLERAGQLPRTLLKKILKKGAASSIFTLSPRLGLSFQLDWIVTAGPLFIKTLTEEASQGSVFCFKANELFKNGLLKFEEEASLVLDR